MSRTLIGVVSRNDQEEAPPLRRCGICGNSYKDDAFAQHMTRAHDWSSASNNERTSSVGRGCAIVVFVVLLVYGVGTTTIPLSGGTRGDQTFYVGIGLVLLLLAAAVWRRWLRQPISEAAAPRVEPPPRRSVLAELWVDARRPDETSTDYLPWAWLIRLDLAFRERLWVRLLALLLVMVGVTLLVLLAFGTGVLR